MKHSWRQIIGVSVAIFVWVSLAVPVRAATLSAAEVAALTNKERTSRGRAALGVSSELQAMAEVKAKDILAQQYFEHTSPDGRTMVDLAKDAGYSYTLLGENLALGNFANNAALVRGWMNSPGHRANILQTKFTEIGIAVVTGTYRGREVWVGVQEFGRPRAACPVVPEAERTTITNAEKGLQEMDKQLRDLRQAVSDATTGDAYNAAVAAFNTEVRAYNQAVQVLRAQVNRFNEKVNAYNRCLAH